MAELTEGRHAGEFIISVANGNLSFDNGVLASGEDLVAGTVLALLAGEYVQLAPGSSGADANAVAILLGNVDATSAAQPCAVVARQSEVIGAALTWPVGITTPQKDAAIADLAALGIIVR